MKLNSVLFACAIVLGGVTVAQAQADMSCADYNKTFDSLDAASKDAITKNQTDTDKKLSDYCRKNPAAKVSEAMEKAMAD